MTLVDPLWQVHFLLCELLKLLIVFRKLIIISAVLQNETRWLTYLSSQVFEDGSTVHCSCGSYSAMAGGPVLQVSVDTTHWELKVKQIKINTNWGDDLSYAKDWKKQFKDIFLHLHCIYSVLQCYLPRYLQTKKSRLLYYNCQICRKVQIYAKYHKKQKFFYPGACNS